MFFQPKRIAIGGGYHGVHATIDVYKKSRGVTLELIDLEAEYREGDLCWLETPLNPTGESRWDSLFFFVVSSLTNCLQRHSILC